VCGALALAALAGAAEPVRQGRVDPAIGTRLAVSPLARDLEARGRIALHVYLEPGADPFMVERSAVRALQAEALGVHPHASGSVLVLASTVAGARRIAEWPGVAWVEQAPEPTPRVGSARLVVQSGSTASAPFDSAGLTGAGQIVGVLDLPLDWDHCAFVDPQHPIGPAHRKIVAYNAPLGSVNAHGTHVCGILAGDSDAAANLRGVAPGARLAFNTIPTLAEAPLLARLELHASQGATIHSNSWGDDQSSAYGGLARAVDQFCWEHDENLVVFAVSNGAALKTPENAKNALAVAATQDAPMHHRLCIGAAGPTADGRRKPDLVAPGCSIFAAYPFGAGCPTVFNSGTSMATPAVAGAAAVARQYFTEGRHRTGTPTPADAFTPTGALLKAALIAGAADVTDAPGWPGNGEGWGRVLLSGSLPLAGSGRSLLVRQAWNNTDDALETGDSIELRFEVTAPGTLRIAVAWHDAPGPFGAADPVVNDLDLSLETPWGAVLSGNAIDTATGESVAGGSPDRRNTVEVVSIGSPTPGIYTARVDAARVLQGRQGFGLIINGAVAGIAGPCNGADLAEPLGVLDLADVNAFAAGFVSAGAAADLTADGLLDLSDINAFVAAFLAGCG